MSSNFQISSRSLPKCNKVGSDKIELQVFSSFTELSDIQNEWDDFIESIKGEIFLTYDWCRIWWKYYGHRRNLFIFTFRYQERLCGILPLFLEKIWMGPFLVRTIKMIGSDFLPVALTIPIKEEFLHEVVHCFIDELRKRYRFDIMHIGPICGKYDSFDTLRKSLSETIDKNYHIRSKISDQQTYFKVANNWEEQVANLSYKQRSNMKRQYERVLKQGIRIESIPANEKNLSQVFDNFVQMHQSHWQELGYPGHFMAWPLSYEFHREVSSIQFDKRRLRLYEIRVDNKCLGYNYAYKFGETYYRFLYARTTQEAVSKYDFSKIDFAEMVKRALIENVKWFDSMRGEYDFKAKLGGETLPIKNLFIISNNIF